MKLVQMMEVSGFESWSKWSHVFGGRDEFCGEQIPAEFADFLVVKNPVQNHVMF